MGLDTHLGFVLLLFSSVPGLSFTLPEGRGWERALGDLRNVRKKLEHEQRVQDARQREGPNGWTVFYFNFDPKLTRRNMDLGQAIRHLLRVTATRITFWRCPIRGLAIKYRRLPRTSYSYDHGETYLLMDFCSLDDEVEAKKVLAFNMLLTGVEHYRGLPNNAFDELVGKIRWLLKAPPSISAEDWLKANAELHSRYQQLLRTHEPELRAHLLGEKGRHQCTVPAWLEAERNRR